MEKLPKRKFSSGIVQLLPLLIVAFLLVGSVAVFSSDQGKIQVNNIKNVVLGESSRDADVQEEVKTEDTKTEVEAPEQEHETEIEDENDIETESEKEVEVKDGSGEAKIKIHQAKNQFSIEQQGFSLQVESNFPLSVNPTTRELTVTTPAGIKTVTILPQQVVDNMLAQGFISQVLGNTSPVTPTSSPSSTPGAATTGTGGVTLVTAQDGSLIYQVEGVKNEKLLGIFTVAVPKTLEVSAQDGTLLNIDQSFFSKFLDAVSI